MGDTTRSKLLAQIASLGLLPQAWLLVMNDVKNRRSATPDTAAVDVSRTNEAWLCSGRVCGWWLTLLEHISSSTLTAAVESKGSTAG
jgi:hypothetical protein